jgi:hypothetical protein
MFEAEGNGEEGADIREKETREANITQLRIKISSWFTY